MDDPLFSTFEFGFRHALAKHTQRHNADIDDPLCSILSRSRPIWLLSRILSFDSTWDYQLFRALWDLDRSHDQDMLEFFHSKQSTKNYITLHSELKTEDQTLEHIARLERDYFGGDVYSLAIARKLTLVSQWSSRYHEPMEHSVRTNGNMFVADRRLWTWLDDRLKDY